MHITYNILKNLRFRKLYTQYNNATVDHHMKIYHRRLLTRYMLTEFG